MNRLLPLLALALALAACGGGGQRKDDAPVAVSAIGGPIQAGDPNRATLATPARVLLGATAQGLVRFDAAGQIEPGLAERWIVIDDGRSFIFRLREAQWSDGDPVTSAQVVKALRRAIAPDSRNALSPFLAVIDEIVEMTPQVIEVRLKRPRPDLLQLFAQPELAVVREGKGSGPFRIARSDARGMLLRPAPDPEAPDEEGPAPEETILLRGERAANALSRFKDGQSDLILGGTFADWPVVTAAGIAPANIRMDSALGLFGLAVTRRDGFLAEPGGRAAVAMAIDRKALTQALNPDWAPVETLLPAQIDSAAPPAQPAWTALTLEARRASARASVAAWRREHGAAPVLRVALPAGPGSTIVWAYVAEAIRAIGADTVRVGAGDDADLRLVDAVAPYDSGRWFVANACAPCSEEAAVLVEAGRDAPDLPTRARRIAEADAALTADGAFIPIAQPLRWSIVALRLRAWQGNSRAWHPLNHLRNDTR
ncbi:MAG: ABC transporter substrate-binding protein [Sphingomonadales bacterium]|nr:MAG: ABC transporter substrate-binding protein [Sphingomonadales bacterium]